MAHANQQRPGDATRFPLHLKVEVEVPSCGTSPFDANLCDDHDANPFGTLQNERLDVMLDAKPSTDSANIVPDLSQTLRGVHSLGASTSLRGSDTEDKGCFTLPPTPHATCHMAPRDGSEEGISGKTPPRHATLAPKFSFGELPRILRDAHDTQALPEMFSAHEQRVPEERPERNHRRRIDEILPGFLYLGGGRAAQSYELVKHHDIDALLACARDVPLPPFATVDSTFDTLHLQMADAADTELESHFGAAFEFLDAMREAGKRVLVYCREGKSRSASIVIAYLIRTHKLDYGRALEHVRAARKEVDPNFSFCSQLSRFSDEVNSNSNNSPSTTPERSPQANIHTIDIDHVSCESSLTVDFLSPNSVSRMAAI